MSEADELAAHGRAFELARSAMLERIRDLEAQLAALEKKLQEQYARCREHDNRVTELLHQDLKAVQSQAIALREALVLAQDELLSPCCQICGWDPTHRREEDSRTWHENQGCEIANIIESTAPTRYEERIRAEEREACAKVADVMAKSYQQAPTKGERTKRGGT